eukprot:TRINITY_DN15351_c0_g1_i6.p1 TRINITY_DN15351_c0_g1~~TRINITY_DN15351_c0_g1_i6.p1  ORF type:complete len:173 (-),score=44.48 TRINITY_DN15351_c0_g1_i6:44-562(-)
MIKGEVLRAVGDLLLDAHGCYIVKTLMERMPPAELQALVNTIAEDESLVFSMCTHSLHTRRAVQYLLDTVDSTFISRLIVARIEEVSTTQQGCIVAQRAMDCAKEPFKTQLFDAVLDRFIEFATDPFANYVVPVSYTHLRAHETPEHLVCRLLLEKKKKKITNLNIHKFKVI